MTSPLLEVKNLHLTLKTSKILHGISFTLYPGEIVGLVGESGCGKSLTASAILGLLPSSHTLSGTIEFKQQNLLDSSLAQLSHIRGTDLSLILQDPSLALNPLIPIGKQLTEGLRYHKKMSQQAAYQIALQWLDRVGISQAKERMQQYPHELSGGMKQRILIAIALICQPSLLIADEPTTALDVTIQAQILDLLQLLQQEEKISILLITHDLGIVAHYCQRVMVMYAGQLIEQGGVEQIFKEPQHPYTQALLQSRRSLAYTFPAPLVCIQDQLHQQDAKRGGCVFSARCPSAMCICEEHTPPLEKTFQGSVLCWLPQAKRETV